MEPNNLITINRKTSLKLNRLCKECEPVIFAYLNMSLPELKKYYNRLSEVLAKDGFFTPLLLGELSAVIASKETNQPVYLCSSCGKYDNNSFGCNCQKKTPKILIINP